MKRALITGISGQDGAYLARFLLKKGYKVYGGYRRLSTLNFWRLHSLDIFDKIELLELDVTDSSSIRYAITKTDAQEIYHLAAQSFVGTSFNQPILTSQITGIAVAKILEELRHYNKKIKFYNAGSSEMFGNAKEKIKDEDTPFNPSSPYAIAKLYGYWFVKTYRHGYDMHVTNGILFNHESSLRGLEFVTRKITNGVAQISLGLLDKLQLGNLTAKRDWGYAPEYVEGMWKMLQKNPDDYVLATNESHSIMEFVNEACKIAGISTSKIKSSKANFRPFDVEHLQGNYSKAKQKLKWKPKTRFKKLVKIMVEEDINRWEMFRKGESFPWDISYTGKNVKKELKS